MALEAIHDSQDDIPEAYRDLYTERDGKWELTGIKGVKTQADIDRLTTAAAKERDEHKATKAKLGIWGDMDHADVMAKLDKLPELEAQVAAGGNEIPQEKLDELVETRIQSRLAPVERDLVNTKKENETLKENNSQLTAASETRALHDHVLGILKPGEEGGILPSAREDALMIAERMFVRRDDSEWVTADKVGVTPGVDATMWFAEMGDKRAHWFPPSEGGGAGGGKGGGGGAGKAEGFSLEDWNLTKQGQYAQQHGLEKANQAAIAAGSSALGIPPPAKA